MVVRLCLLDRQPSGTECTRMSEWEQVVTTLIMQYSIVKTNHAIDDEQRKKRTTLYCMAVYM